MHTIKNTIEISKSPAAVLAAVTTKAGIQGWWTLDCECNEALRLATFRFVKPQGTMSVTFQLERADDKGVEMICVAQDGQPDWLGTRLAFDISPSSAGTRLELVHSGYPARNEVYDMCTQGWSYFLASLKSYVETGTGTPFGATPPPAFASTSVARA